MGRGDGSFRFGIRAGGVEYLGCGAVFAKMDSSIRASQGANLCPKTRMWWSVGERGARWLNAMRMLVAVN